MTFNEALFILRHGSAEGKHKYLQAVQIIENEVKCLQERNERLQAEKEAMHIDLVTAEEYAMKLKLENDKLKEKNESLINARIATLKDLAVADEKCKRLQSEKKMLESRQLRTGDTILIYGNRYVVIDFYHSFITEGERLVAVKPFPTPIDDNPPKKKWWRFWR